MALLCVTIGFTVGFMHRGALAVRTEVEETDAFSEASHCDGVECKRDEYYKWCSIKAKDETVIATFTHFSQTWCDDQLERIDASINGTDAGLGPATEDLLRMMSEVLNIIESGQDKRWASVAKFGGAWADCHRDGSTCEDCVMRRGGAPRFTVTSHACAYDLSNRRCVNAESAVADAVRKTGSCSPAKLDSEWPSLETSLAEAGTDLNISDETHHTTLATTGNFSSQRKNHHGVNRALLVSYEYSTSKAPLAGTFPDIARVFAHLVEKRNFDPRNIHVLTDTESHNGHDAHKFFPGAQFFQTDEYGTPNEFSVIMKGAISGVSPGDFFFFHYSGHGSTQQDHNGDELDLRDETIIAPNMEPIVDDDFYEQLIDIPAGVNTFVMVDACHSEGFSDLPFNYMQHSRIWCTDWTSPSRPLPQGTITYVSGSQNYQTSGDLGYGGALSLHAIDEWTHPKVMHEALVDVDRALTTQTPSLSAFPTFRDTELMDPYDPTTKVRRDMSSSQPSRRYSSQFQAPSLCTHGGVNKSGTLDERPAWLRRQAENEFKIEPRLNDASAPYTGLVEGWISDRPVLKPLPKLDDFHPPVEEHEDRMAAMRKKLDAMRAMRAKMMDDAVLQAGLRSD